MRIGSIVETVADFTEVSKVWGYNYPDKGQLLTIRLIEDHPVPDVAALGIVLLYFEELPDLVGVCNKKADGIPNFVELITSHNLGEWECTLKKDYIVGLPADLICEIITNQNKTNYPSMQPFFSGSGRIFWL